MSGRAVFVAALAAACGLLVLGVDIFDRVPELETWTHGPEAHCDDAACAELLA